MGWERWKQIGDPKALSWLGLLPGRSVLERRGKTWVERVVLGPMAESFPLRANSCPLRVFWEPSRPRVTMP